MFRKMQICPNCKIGKESYEDDPQSHCCPHIEHMKDGRCSYYVPILKPSEISGVKKGK